MCYLLPWQAAAPAAHPCKPDWEIVPSRALLEFLIKSRAAVPLREGACNSDEAAAAREEGNSESLLQRLRVPALRQDFQRHGKLKEILLGCISEERLRLQTCNTWRLQRGPVLNYVSFHEPQKRLDTLMCGSRAAIVRRPSGFTRWSLKTSS